MFKDNHDPTLFGSPALETANMTVSHCREVMEKTGMTTEAQRLEGIEITDPRMARVALDVLQNMRVRAEAGYAAHARQIAIDSIRSVLQS